MSVQLDNVKMWEYLIKQSEEYLIFCQIAAWLKEALHEQGLEYKDGHIISILEPNWTIEEGKYYMCIQNLCPPQTSNQYNFIKDKIYCACGDSEIKDDDGNLAVFLSDYPIAEYFRPATEEEIKGNNGGISPKFKEGDKVYNRKLNAEGLILGTSYEDGNVTIKSDKLAPNVFPISIEGLKDWELVEPKQENSPILSNSSNTAKNDELTEFELCLFDWLSSDTGGVLTNDSMRQVARNRAKELMDIARREIAEGIENDRIVMLNNRFADVPQEDRFRFDSYFYAEGIRDVVKKLKED